MPPVIETISGLRGLYPAGITIEYAFDAACRFAVWLGGGDVVVGTDTRVSSPLLGRAVASGLMHGGCNALWAGVTTTPELFRYVRRAGLAGGVMVTASHNPKEWNGIKFVKNGRGLFEDELGQVLSRSCRVSRFGQSRQVDSSEYFDEIRSILETVGVDGIKVALDTGGGSACLHVPRLFAKAGADVVVINGNPGVFTRIIDPTSDDLAELRKFVISERCDLGFAFDCDGDRLQVVDGEGNKMPSDYALMVAVSEVETGKSVAISVDTSDAVLEAAKTAGVQVVLTPVGEANVVKAILENGCFLGGEGSSAGVIDPSFSLCRDGLLASARIIRHFIREGGLSLGRLSEYVQVRTKIDVESKFVPQVLRSLQKEHPDAVTIDGVKFRTRKGWVLVRPSRTENALRVSAEAGSRVDALSLIEDVKDAVKSTMKVR